jgi:hypothetical protein
MPHFTETRPGTENLCNHIENAGGLRVDDVQQFLTAVWQYALFRANWSRDIAEEMALHDCDCDVDPELV